MWLTQLGDEKANGMRADEPLPSNRRLSAAQKLESELFEKSVDEVYPISDTKFNVVNAR